MRDIAHLEFGLNPPAQIEFEMRYVAHVHKVLTMNELFGI